MIPTEKELIDFIEKHENLVNLTMIAQFFDIKNSTAADIVNPLVKKKVLEIKKLGGSKIVRIKNKK